MEPAVVWAGSQGGGQLAPGNHGVSCVSPLCVYARVCVWISVVFFFFFHNSPLPETLTLHLKTVNFPLYVSVFEKL